jgi:hypothetical protein
MLLVKGSLYPKRNGTEREITDFFSLATSSKIIRLFNYDCPRNWKKQSRIVDESSLMINLDSERNQVGDLICENRKNLLPTKKMRKSPDPWDQCYKITNFLKKLECLLE